MKTLFSLVPLLLLTLWATTPVRGQQINVVLKSPEADEVVGTTLSIEADITATFSLKSIRAVIDSTDLETVLVADKAPGSNRILYVGTLDLTPIPEGTYDLKIIATDINDNAQEYVQEIIYNLPPTIQWEGINPEQAINDAFLPFCISCTDTAEQGCNVEIRISWPEDYFYFTGPHGMHRFLSGRDTVCGSLDLLDYQGGYIYVNVIAKDQYDQRTYGQRMMFVELSPFLEKIDEVDGYILGVDSSRIFFSQEAETLKKPAVLYRDSRVIKPVNLDENRSVMYERISLTTREKVVRAPIMTQPGVVFPSVRYENTTLPQYEIETKLTKQFHYWDGDSLRRFQIDGDTTSGLRAIFTAGNNLIVSGTDLDYYSTLPVGTLLPLGDFNVSSLQADGSFIHMAVIDDTRSELYMVQSGVPIPIANDPNYTYINPKYNGKAVVFYRAPVVSIGRQPPYYELVIQQGGEEEVMPSVDKDVYAKGFLLNGDYLAFFQKDELQQINAFVMHLPTGRVTQRTYFGPNFHFLAEQLAPSGALLVAATNPEKNEGSDAYHVSISTETGQQYIASNAVRFYLDRGLPFASMGNSLYRIRPDVAPPTLQPGSVEMEIQDKIRVFSRADFAPMYNHAKHWTHTRLERGPAHGKLTLLQRAPYQELDWAKGASISVVAWENTRYRPDENFTGKDTLWLNFSNGYQYSDAPTYMVLEVKDATVSQEELFGLRPYRVFPNPTEGKLIIHTPRQQLLYLSLTDLAGRTRLTQTWNSLPEGRKEWDLGGLPSGVYFLCVQAGNQRWVERILLR